MAETQTQKETVATGITPSSPCSIKDNQLDDKYAHLLAKLSELLESCDPWIGWRWEEDIRRSKELAEIVRKGHDTFYEMLCRLVDFVGGEVDQGNDGVLYHFLIEVMGFTYEAVRIHDGKQECLAA